MWRRKPLCIMSYRHLKRIRHDDHRNLLLAIKHVDVKAQKNFVKDLLSKENIEVTSSEEIKCQNKQTRFEHEKGFSGSSIDTKKEQLVFSVTDKNMCVQTNMKHSPEILFQGKESEKNDTNKIVNEDNQQIATDIIELTSDFNRPSCTENVLETKIKEWVSVYKVKHNCLSALLVIMNNHFSDLNLPKTAKRFLKTPRKVDIVKMPPGSYVHMGMKKGIENYLNKRNDKTINHLKLQIGIDGLPIGEKSSNNQ